MFRRLLIALASFGAFAASACSYGSAVDIAPMNARISKPAVASGDYCEVKGHDGGKAAPFTVVSREECVPIIWNEATRTYTMKDLEKPDNDATAPVIKLSSNLYAAQVATPESKTEDRFQLFVFLSSGNAFAMLDPLETEPLKALSAKHNKLTFKPDGNGRPFIAAGKPEDIRSFLKDAAKESLRILKAEDGDLSIGIRDTAGAPDHEASKSQAKDIEAVLKLAKSMTPR